MLSRGHYLKAAHKYKLAAENALTTAEKELFSIMHLNAHKRNGITHLKLQDSAMGVWLLRKSGMSEWEIANFVQKYIKAKSVIL